MSSDEFLEQIKRASPDWLRRQIMVSNRLIRETEQLLRGAGPEAKDLQTALWGEKKHRHILQQELSRRGGNQ